MSFMVKKLINLWAATALYERKVFLPIGITVIPLHKYIWKIDLGDQEAGDQQLPNCS